MTTPVEFCVRFDGAAPGLESHRLSLAAFQTPLSKLLQALRQMADSVKDGSEGTDRKNRSRTGKFGKLLDLQLATITDGCVNLNFSLVTTKTDEFTDQQRESLATMTVQRFIDELKTEWDGAAPRVNGIRRYLDSLPDNVTTHEYEGRMGGNVINSAKLSTKIATNVDSNEDFRQTAPRLRQVTARITSIRFDSKDGCVKLRTVFGEKFVCQASPELLDLAARLHKFSVVAQILVRHDVARLLSLRDEQSTHEPLTEEARREYLYQNWSNTLKRLAE